MIDRIADHLADHGIVVGGMGFVSGLEIENQPCAAAEHTPGTERLAAFEPAKEYDFVRIRNIKRFAVHFLARQRKPVFDALRDGMPGQYRPNSLLCTRLEP